MSAGELKVCPFCRNDKDLLVGSNKDITGEGVGDNFAVCCDIVKGGCGATGGFRATKAKAIKAWNKRAI